MQAATMQAPHARFNNTESVYDALCAIQELDEGIVQALGADGYALLHSIAVHAQGTFFHSMRVLDLMRAAGYAQFSDEAAAVLLHDCGKLFAPQRFAENGGSAGQPPAWMIASHVDHGLDMVRPFKLSPLTRSAINEHHGTQQIGGSGVSYKGEAPKTLFTAVLMMADTMEAITSGQGRERAELLLPGICEHRIQEGQFDAVGHESIRAATQRLVDAPEPEQPDSHSW